MGWFKRLVQTTPFFNPVKGRNAPIAPNFRDAPDYAGHLDEALEYFAQTLGLSDDFIVRTVEMNGVSAALVFYSSVCDKRSIEDTLRSVHTHRFPRRMPKNLAQYMIERVLTGADAIFMWNMFEIREAVASGKLVLLMDGTSPAIVISAKAVEHRSPEQPTIESASRGSQVSFVEHIDINLGQIRQSLATDTLVIRKWVIGYRSHRTVALIYLRDIANPTLVDTVAKRLEAIHIDHISGSAAIEQRISDHPWSMFNLTRTTQRIDSVGRELNQGKVAIIVDGDPTVLLAPATFQDFFQTEEDYVHSWMEATFVRWLRIVSFVLAVWLPSLYVAFADFSPELLPKTMALQIAQSRQGVPFPAVMEVFIMQVVIEILREATLRMPKAMGQTIGIVGGLVVGQAAVEAGIVSNILIIIVALTAISVFVTPSYEFAVVIRLGAWLMIIGATFVGFYGIVLGTMWILYEICNTKSFGVPYVDPFGGDHVRDVFIDGLVRLPITVMDKRAEHLHATDRTGNTDYNEPAPHPQLEKGQQFGTRTVGRRHK
ncbi:spore germination protein [Alicyclobacillus acidiphilus]|uniref:spore germination protein n=1 Tax=Alicyclobacillus acidiphilus TaxID=182455 RepID=UPI0008349C6A|nr:spore germination protein [Alicyclobacillus acidiphilus]